MICPTLETAEIDGYAKCKHRGACRTPAISGVVDCAELGRRLACLDHGLGQ